MLLMKPLADDEVFDVLRGLDELSSATEDDELRRVAEAAEGSVRRGAALLASDSLKLRDTLTGMLERLPDIDYAACTLCPRSSRAATGQPAFDLFIAFIQDWLHERLTRGAAMGDARLAGWAVLWEKTARAAREAEIYNLDRRPLVLAIFSDLAAASRG